MVDVETCNVFALKSIAKSIDAEYLTNFIQDNYPEQLLRLINLFSINKSFLFEQFKTLHQESNAPLIGSINIRNQIIDVDSYVKELIYDISTNISNIENLLLKNKVPYEIPDEDLNKITEDELNVLKKKKYSLSAILKKINTDEYENYFIDKLFSNKISDKKNTELKDEALIYYYDYDLETKRFYRKDCKFKDISNELTLEIILSNIKYYSNNYFNPNKRNNETIDLFNNFIKPNSIFKFDDDTFVKDTFFKNPHINPFHIIIFILKNLLWNPYTNTFFNTSYENKEQNTLVQCSDFYYKIIETIQLYDEKYINDFIVFHFYGLFYDMLINEDLKNEWSWNNGIPYFVSVTGDYTKEEFSSILKEFLSPEDIDVLLNNLTNYKKIHIDFIRYLTIINSSLEYEDINNENIDYENLQFKIAKNIDNTSYFVLNRFNNPFDLSDSFNEEKRRLLGYSVDGTYNERNDKILKIAKEFSDLCIQISYARENIKTLIQQYSYIGTNKIISDIVRDYFIKNYAKRRRLAINFR